MKILVSLLVSAVVSSAARADPEHFLSLSAVAGIPRQAVEIRLDAPADAEMTLAGKDAKSFSAKQVGEGRWEVDIQPDRRAGRYFAELRIGAETVSLNGLATNALEGENEPPLDRIVECLGVPVNVGGKALRLDLKAATIGASVVGTKFRRAGDGPVRITPVARYSPPGNYPFGWRAEEEHVIGSLAGSKKIPDAHQRLLPPMENGKRQVDFTPDEEPFSLFVKAGKRSVGTDPAAYPTDLLNAVRIYPASAFQGRKLKNAFLVCFEEASNGDYQDAVLLVENVAIAR